ncbi:RNA binding protein, heterogenous nuclear RNP-K like protein [Basidiobolus ranarum]|uniref:RNA binding protein, heterogenous nuclear RNP-K like protein n=1 Tax=Basidiobolus ranarum TaxID=34480 RepID=A0ABR2X4P5_9FUNG
MSNPTNVMSYHENFNPNEAVARFARLSIDPLNRHQFSPNEEPKSEGSPLSNSGASQSLFEKHAPFNLPEKPVSVSSSENPSTEENKVFDSQLTLRALVSTKEAGVIIGKAGKNVAELREITGVKAGVSKVVQGVHDRVLSVTGSLDGVAQAYSMIAQTMLENPITTSPPTTPVSPVKPTTTGSASIRLLISHNLMGTIIGRQGIKIKQIQDISGVRMVASKEMLPQSTERIVEVQGSVEAIKVAVWEIGKCLIEDWERGVGTVLYNPAVRLNTSYARHPEHGARREYTRTGNGSDFSRPLADGRNTNDTHMANNRPAFPNNVNMTTQQISIPSDMVGCIIGKGGSKISEIRRLSGSRISIAKVPHNETGERMFTIIGTPESNEKALFLLYSQLEAEKEKRINAVAPNGEEAPAM